MVWLNVAIFTWQHHNTIRRATSCLLLVLLCSILLQTESILFKMKVEAYIYGQTTIDKLPENILLHIFGYLTVTDRCRLLRVCKKWSRIFSDKSLWRHVDLRNSRLRLHELWDIVTKHFSQCLLTLKIRGYAFTGAKNRRKYSLSNEVLQEIGTRCRHLQVLQLSECNIGNVSFNCLPSSITSLEIIKPIFKPRWLKGKQTSLPKLECLKFESSAEVGNFDMQDVVGWTNLKYLSLSGCYSVGSLGVLMIASHLFQLEFLNLSSTDLGDFVIVHIAENLKKLKELVIANCTEITDIGVGSISKGLPVLNSLDISYCEHITMTGLKSLFVSKITKLTVVRLTRLSEEEKLALQRGFSENFVLVA